MSRAGFTPQERAGLIGLLHSRRSVAPKRLLPPGPDEVTLREIVGAALAAPDHCGLRPWKFLQVTPGQRSRLADLFAQEKREHEPDASTDDVEKERARAHNAPVLLAALLEKVENHPKVPVSEQLVSLGAAIQNLLLAAHARGFGAMLTSGRKVASPLIQNAFCLSPRQLLVGFISIGTASEPPKPRRPARIEDHFEDWKDRKPGG
ncbi:MAG: nitroreductase [Hyphomicrobiales bacterium]